MNKRRYNNQCKKGFTLAEVLITLVIIGVVTALTIPSLLASVNEKTYDAKRQGFATRMAQAISQLGMLNAYEAEGSEEDKINNSSMNFVVEGLSKAYAITAVCEIENFKACDFTETIKYWDGIVKNTEKYKQWSDLNGAFDAAKLGGLNTKGVAFKTKNGESVLLWYNPRCIAEQTVEPDTVIDPELGPGVKNFAKEICINMIYDLDGGKKGPNNIPRDIGVAIVLYPDTPYFVMPKTVVYNAGSYPSYVENETSTSVSTACAKFASGYSSIYGVGAWELVNKETAYAMGANKDILGSGPTNAFQWTSNIEGPSGTDYGWQVNSVNALAKLELRNLPAPGLCTIIDR